MQVRLNGVCCWVHGGVAGFMVNPPATVGVRPNFRFIEALCHEQSNIGGYGVLITMNLTTWRTWHKKAARRRLDLFAVINGDLGIDVGRN